MNTHLSVAEAAKTWEVSVFRVHSIIKKLPYEVPRNAQGHYMLIPPIFEDIGTRLGVCTHQANHSNLLDNKSLVELLTNLSDLSKNLNDLSQNVNNVLRTLNSLIQKQLE